MAVPSRARRRRAPSRQRAAKSWPKRRGAWVQEIAGWPLSCWPGAEAGPRAAWGQGARSTQAMARPKLRPSSTSTPRRPAIPTSQAPRNGAAINTSPSLLANRPLARWRATPAGTSRGIRLAKQSTKLASAAAASPCRGSRASRLGAPPPRSAVSSSAASARVPRAPRPLATTITRRRRHCCRWGPTTGRARILAT